VSRTKNSTQDPRNDPEPAYLELSRMLREGRSWSGRERNCFFLNTGGARFANVSAVSGFDFPDDARAAALSDWDGDGDLDVWVSNRNAPRLRLLRNGATGSHYLALRLVGDGVTTPRDAIGARVEMRRAGSSGRPLLRTIRAGDGFLSQSTRWAVFGLGTSADDADVVVRWPGGASEEFRGLRAGGRYRIVQGSGQAVALDAPARPSVLQPSLPELPAPTSQARIPLVSLLRIPEVHWVGFDGTAQRIDPPPGKALLVVLWATWCAPCLVELDELAGRSAADLERAGVGVLALSVDGLGDARSDSAKAASIARDRKWPFPAGRAAAETVQSLQHLRNLHLPLHLPLPVPTSFLVDASRRLVAIYSGPASARAVVEDLAASRGSRRERWLHAAPLGGSAIESDAAELAARQIEAQTRFLFALDLAQAGRADDARGQYEDVIALMPDFAEAHSNLGLLALRRGDLEVAEAQCRKALSARADFPEANYNLGAVLERRGDLQRAEAAYRDALRQKPSLPEANNALGVLLAKTARLDEALASFEREVAVNPSFVEARNNLGLALLQRQREREAETQLREALRLDPAHADAHNNLGVALRRQGKLEDALKEYAEAVRLQPRFLEARNNLGLAYLALGKAAEAAAEFTRALEIDAGFAPARKNLERAQAAVRDAPAR